MTDLDDRLRASAHRWIDAEVATLRTDPGGYLDTAFAEVRTRIGNATPPSRPRDARARTWAVAASVVALVAGGVALVLTLAGDDELRSADVTVPTTAEATAPPNSIDAASTTVLAPDRTTAAPLPTPAGDTLAVAEPAVVTQGAAVAVTITPSGVVPRRCVDAVLVAVYDGARRDGRPTTLGAVGSSGVLVPFDPATDRACAPAPSADPVTVSVPTTLTEGEYRWCISPGNAPEACASVTVVAPPAVTDAAPGPSPVPYLVRRALLAADPATGLTFELRDIAPDGSDVGRSEADLLDLSAFPVDLGADMAMGLSGNDPIGPIDGRCGAKGFAFRSNTSGDVRDVPVIAAGSTVVGNAARVVLGRDVCPAGTRWGDPGTYFELVAYDPTVADPAPTQLVRIDPDPGAVLFDDGTVVYSTDALHAASISPSGGHVAAEQPLNSEDSRWHVYSTLAAGGPVALGSACTAPGDIVGRPSFPSADVVVVARRCGPSADGPTGLVVESVSLTDLGPVWSQQVDLVAINSYSDTVGNVSATFVGGELWVIVASSAGIEQPVRAVLLHGDAELDITRSDDPDVHGYAFGAAELVFPSDMPS